MFEKLERAAELEGLFAPRWDDYLAARDRFLARLQAERVLREVVRRLEAPTPIRSIADCGGAGRAERP